MLPILLASFLFLLLMAVISVYGYRAYVRPARIYDRVGGIAETGVDTAETVSVKPRDVVVRVFEQIGEQIPLTPGDQTATKRDLVMAGFRSDGAIRIFFGIKVMFCVVMFLFSLTLHRQRGDPENCLYYRLIHLRLLILSAHIRKIRCAHSFIFVTCQSSALWGTDP